MYKEIEYLSDQAFYLHPYLLNLISSLCDLNNQNCHDYA